MSDAGSIVPCMVPELDLWRKKPVQACITGRVVEKLKPISAITAKPEVLEFLCPGRALHYLDINNLVLRMVVHLSKETTDENLGENDNKNSVVDCTLHSLFSQCEIFLSEKPVVKSPHLYAYKSVLDIYTTSGRDAREGPLATVPVLPDSDPTSQTNPECTKRGKPYLKSQRVELMGKLHADICHLEEGAFILDNVPLRVRLTLNPNRFYVWSGATTPDVRLLVDDAELFVPFYFGNAELGLGMEMALAQQPATYRFKGAQLKTFIHPANTSNLDIPIAVSGKLPTNILLTMVSAADYNGNTKTNPYNFAANNIQELSFFCNGVERRFLSNMEIEQGCSTLLRSIYSDFGRGTEESGAGVYTLEKMAKGRFAVAVDLTVDHSGRGPSQNLDQHGTVRIQGRFKEGPSQSLVILMYCLYDSVMEISASREVSLF